MRPRHSHNKSHCVKMALGLRQVVFPPGQGSARSRPGRDDAAEQLSHHPPDEPAARTGNRRDNRWRSASQAERYLSRFTPKQRSSDFALLCRIEAQVRRFLPLRLPKATHHASAVECPQLSSDGGGARTRGNLESFVQLCQAVPFCASWCHFDFDSDHSRPWATQTWPAQRTADVLAWPTLPHGSRRSP